MLSHLVQVLSYLEPPLVLIAVLTGGARELLIQQLISPLVVYLYLALFSFSVLDLLARRFLRTSRDGIAPAVLNYVLTIAATLLFLSSLFLIRQYGSTAHVFAVATFIAVRLLRSLPLFRRNVFLFLAGSLIANSTLGAVLFFFLLNDLLVIPTVIAFAFATLISYCDLYVFFSNSPSQGKYSAMLKSRLEFFPFLGLSLFLLGALSGALPERFLACSAVIPILIYSASSVRASLPTTRPDEKKSAQHPLDIGFLPWKCAIVPVSLVVIQAVLAIGR